MAIPQFTDMMFPILQKMSDGQVYTRKNIADFVVSYFNLTPDECNERIKNGSFRYIGRSGWAITYLCCSFFETKNIENAQLIDRIERGKYKINKNGLIIAQSENKFNQWLMSVYKINITKKTNKNDDKNKKQELTPEENISSFIDELNNSVKREILNIILDKEPRFFEYLVIKLLEKIGYGTGQLTANGADGGIDGIIDEDVLGFSKIYIQAKRFDKQSISRPEIQKFVGVLATKPTKKGLFITTSQFSDDAKKFAETLQGYSLILIDSERLLDLMLKYKLGVQVKEVKEIFSIDNDFFDEEDNY